MKIKKTFQGELPENRVVNTYSDSLTDAYSANYLNGKLRNVEVSSTEPTNGKDIWVQIGKNLFNKNSCLISGKYLASDGSLGDDTTLFYQETYIPVEPNTSYVISNANNENHRICEYDANKTFLTRFLNDNSSLSCIFTTGPATKFIRVSGMLTNIDSLQVEQGEFKTDYEEYIPKKIYVKKDNKYELVYDEVNTRKEVYVGPYEPKSGEDVWIRKSKNLYCRENEQGRISINDGGNRVTSDWTRTSGYIPVLSEKTYSMTVVQGYNQMVLCYYNSTQYLGHEIKQIGSRATFTTPAGCNQLRVAFDHGTLKQCMLVEGETSVDYEKYIDKAIFVRNGTKYVKFNNVGNNDELVISCIRSKNMFNKNSNLLALAGIYGIALSNFIDKTMLGRQVTISIDRSVYNIEFAKSENSDILLSKHYSNKLTFVVTQDLLDVSTQRYLFINTDGSHWVSDKATQLTYNIQCEFGDERTEYVEYYDPSNSHVYSGTEQVVGMWGDKPLYQRHINLGLVGSQYNQNQHIVEGSFKAAPICSVFLEHPNSGNTLTLPAVFNKETTYFDASARTEDNKLIVDTFRPTAAPWSDWNICVVVNYTKTTD